MSVYRKTAKKSGIAKIVRRSLKSCSIKTIQRNSKIQKYVVNVKKIKIKPQLNAWSVLNIFINNVMEKLE